MVIGFGMFEVDLRTDQRAGDGAEPHRDFLEAENVSLRLLLAQAEINARSLLANAGIEGREREASDKLQKLILEELHHRIKNTLATVGPSSPRACVICREPNTRNTPSKAD